MWKILKCEVCWDDFSTTKFTKCSKCRYRESKLIKTSDSMMLETMELTGLDQLQVESLLEKIPHSSIRMMYEWWKKKRTLHQRLGDFTYVI